MSATHCSSRRSGQLAGFAKDGLVLPFGLFALFVRMEVGEFHFAVVPANAAIMPHLSGELIVENQNGKRK